MKTPHATLRPYVPFTLRPALLSCLVALGVAACGGDGVDDPAASAGDAAGQLNDGTPSNDGAGDDDDSGATLDVGPAEDASVKKDGAAGSENLVALGESCEAHTDCDSGLCGWTRLGKRCVAACDTDQKCAPGLACLVLQPGVAAGLSGCIDRHADICRPCKTDAECAAGATCLSMGEAEGSFCATPCVPKSTVDADKCPKGFACTADAKGKGWCGPKAGECLCTPRAVFSNAETQCATTNDAGSCAGSRVCSKDGLSECDSVAPKLESCDGLDNDCDGQTDEDIAKQPCKVDNPNGTCGGVQTCKSAKLVCDALTPGAEVCDGLDNDCNGKTDEGSVDTDGDKSADCIDADDDGDGVIDTKDNCPLIANPKQVNTDATLAGNDSLGDACDPDDDGDGVIDTKDNCPLNANPKQTDTDNDKAGDACDTDNDGDGVLDAKDNCALIANKNQLDTDKDGQGDACDSDDDADGSDDAKDNCPMVANPKQADTDGDKKGDACDEDDDGDGVNDTTDNCPLTSNKLQLNSDANGKNPDKKGDACDDDDDGDGVLDAKDNCPLTHNPQQTNTDSGKTGGDGKGDACDDDDDGDGFFDTSDNCPLTVNKGQLDTDKDSKGNACDDDDDGDGWLDLSDNCTLTANPKQIDLDKDGKGNACDPDDDGDGKPDKVDNCPGVKNPNQLDTDKDGKGNACDSDDDGDGKLDNADNCPLMANQQQLDTDKDGKGNACDDDDDGDGDPDTKDCASLDASIHHKAAETCNDKDDDCDSVTDEPDAQGCTTYHADYDEDGFGITGNSACLCAKKYPYLVDTLAKLDCAPSDKLIHPNAVEVCDGKDNDCDSNTDNATGGCDPGSQNKPAASCLALLKANPGTGNGLYWISASGDKTKAVKLYCLMSGGGWTRVTVENKTQSAGWSDGKLVSVTVDGKATTLHGLWGKGGVSAKGFSLLGIAHTHVKVGGRYWALGSWDDEKNGAQVWIDNQFKWGKNKRLDKGGGAGWTTTKFVPAIWSASAVHGFWSLWNVIPAMAHTKNTVNVRFATGLDQGAGDEAFAFSLVSVWVK
ncbi:MAG: thrombospondin type 3 repeat-containing protein [Myxococcales bacterium]|nr:thrombospondin type 3 repeat-containing protein [Myxococcales bacterium]